VPCVKLDRKRGCLSWLAHGLHVHYIGAEALNKFTSNPITTCLQCLGIGYSNVFPTISLDVNRVHYVHAQVWVHYINTCTTQPPSMSTWSKCKVYTVSESFMWQCSQSFGKNISKLIFCSNEPNLQLFRCHFLSHKMKIELNVFGLAWKKKTLS
jgi:hypothetical protein